MFADVLVVSYDGQSHLDEITRLISPVELKMDDRYGLIVEGVVEQFPSRPGRGPTVMQVRFHDLALGVKTDSIRFDNYWFQILRHEPDSLRDLSILFGIPQEGVRIGGRRHVRNLVSILSGEASADDLLRFPGAGLRWLESATYSEEDVEAFEAVGGTWLEFPATQGFDMPLRDLIYILAAERRYHYLEPGFERAALSLLRGWMEGALVGSNSDSDTGRRLSGHFNVSFGAGITVPGSGWVYDPPDVRAAFESLRDANSMDEKAAAKSALKVAVAGHAGGYLGGRINIADPASAVDPSEVALVWIDILRALEFFKVNSSLVEQSLLGLPGNLVAYCNDPDFADPRQNDRHDLRSHVEQLATELFKPGDDLEAPGRKKLYENLWNTLLSKTARTVKQAGCEASILAAAGWGTPTELDSRAEALMNRMESLAGSLAGKTLLAQQATGDQLSRYLSEIEKYNQWLEATMIIAGAMSVTPERNGVNPGAAMNRNIEAFRNKTREIQEQWEQDKSGDPYRKRDFEQTLFWREMLLSKWEEQPTS